jgi:N-acetyl-gamma-glutamyl-phosphate reductase
MSNTAQTAVGGVTGYAGAELARLLLHHPRLQGTPPVFAGRVEANDEARGGIMSNRASGFPKRLIAACV